MTVDELQVLITANTNELRKEINKANQTISGLKKSADKGATGVSTAFKKLKTGIVALGIGKVIKDSIQSGMDAIESDNLFETVFDKNADAVKSWSQEMAGALGLSEYAMRKNAGVIFNMTSSMGIAEENALKMSKGITLLTEDMASFYNLDSAEAFNKLRAGITGETEPLKALGILVDENTVKQVAYSEGIAENGAELTQQQKVLARYVAILKQTGNAQGDLANTLDSPSNQLRILKQQVQNLGIAFSNFLMPVLKAVLPYITAFTKLVTTAINRLTAFFGLTGNNDLSEETKKSNENIGGIGDGLDDANKKAKKLKQSLAGFDEMNVLNDNSSDSTDTSGGGGSTSTVGLDFDLSEYDAHLELLSGKTKEVTETLESIFADLGKNIDFTNLLNSFDRLKKAVEPITSKIWDGLKWGYEKILKPVATWTINDFVPAFLNGVSGALELLNPFLESFMKLGGWLWDSFLSPIAEWTGGVVVDVLNGTGDALGVIGDWASANQGVIDAMVTSFAIFFGLWKLTELLAFIQMSGGLVGAFTAIKTGIVTTAQTIWNALSVVGTAVTTALGVAFNFLCSPITLVVLAIGAVIAIVVLLVKNWDTVKETAIKAWDKIKEIWGVVAEWINTKVVQPIKNFFSGLWDGIKSIFSSVGTWFKNIFTSAWDGIKSAFSKVKDFFTGIWDTIKGIFSKVGSVIADAISGAVKNAVNTVLSLAIKIINGFISAINLAIGVINLIPGVDIKKLDKMEVPKLARGGIIDKPTVAMVGEAGKEAVMPLERNTGWIDQLAGKIGDKIGGVAGNIKLIVKLGEDTIFDKFIEYGKEKAFETNGEVVFV